MKTLLASISYIHDRPMADMVSLWRSVNERLNGDMDIVLVDSASPFAPHKLLGWERTVLEREGDIPYKLGHRSVVSFTDNIGHLSRGGQNGAGRAFSKCLEIAVFNGYDYVAIVESDLLFAKPIAPIVERLSEHWINAACCWNFYYQFIESGIFFANCLWLHQSDFVNRYDWRNHNELPELVLERTCGGELFMLPYRGFRNDMNNVNVANLREACRYGLDWITHVDERTARVFLDMNGLVGIV